MTLRAALKAYECYIIVSCYMAFHQVTASSLTPSRPAPQVPQRSNTDQSMYSSTSSLASAGYKTSFSFNAQTASGSSYATSYSGIGASPIRTSVSASSSEVVRTGWASVKEDAFASIFWNRKWLILKENTLTFHRNEVSPFFPFNRRRLDGSFDLDCSFATGCRCSKHNYA